MVETSDWLSDDEREEGEVVSTATTTASSAADSEWTAGEAANYGAQRPSVGPSTATASGFTQSRKTFHREEMAFEEGDHVYMWCPFWVFQKAYAHHGIVVNRDAYAGTVTIFDFSCLVDERETDKLGFLSKSFQKPSPGKSSSISTKKSDGKDSDRTSVSNSSSGGVGGSINNTHPNLRYYTIDGSEAQRDWKKVEYDAPFLESLWRRAGTVSRKTCDPVDRVLARVDFLLNNLHLLSSYNLLESNCEHVAVWCKTGDFCSLQLLSRMTSAMLWNGPLALVSVAAFFRHRSRWKETTESLNASYDCWRATNDPESTLVEAVKVLSSKF